MKKTICLVDANSIGNANHNATKLTVGDMETQAVVGCVKSAKKLIEDYPGCGFIWLWDNRAQWRFDMYPDYKSNRKPKDEKQAESKEQYKNQIPYIQKALNWLGVAQLEAQNYEADDLAGWLTSTLKNEIVLITGDMDWAQLVNEKTVFFDPIRDKHINTVNFFQMTGYKNPEHFLDGKCLMGDSSDCITGVGGIGKTTAPQFVAEFDGVVGFLEQVEYGKYKPRLKKEVNLAGGEGLERYYRNMKLMRLIGKEAPESPQMIKGAFEPDSFLSLCYDLNIKSIYDDFDGFIEPFERAWNGRNKS